MATIVIYTCSKTRATRVNSSVGNFFLNSGIYKSDFTRVNYTCKNYKCNFFIELTPVIKLISEYSDYNFVSEINLLSWKTL